MTASVRSTNVSTQKAGSGFRPRLTLCASYEFGDGPEQLVFRLWFGEKIVRNQRPTATMRKEIGNLHVEGSAVGENIGLMQREAHSPMCRGRDASGRRLNRCKVFLGLEALMRAARS
jgi:hypothetical protein